MHAGSLFRIALIATLMAITPTAKAAPAGPVSAASLVRPGDPVFGNPRGRVTIVDFYDTSCGPCRIMNRRIERLIARDRDVRYVPVNVPILGDQSVLGAQALVAASRQGRFPAMLNALMAQRRLPTTALMQADAARLGFDLPRFARDLAGPATVRTVDAELQRGAALGVQYVPVVYIGRNRIPGAMSYRDLRRLVRHPNRAVVAEVAGSPPGL